MNDSENINIAPGSVPYGEPQPQAFQQPVMPAPTSNPLLDRLRVPPEIHKIPSGGQFYKPGVLSCENGEVHIHPMTALDELEIKSPDLLFNGEAMINVIRRCVPDVKHPEELFTKDVDFIMLALRKATYGNEYEIHYRHDCKDAKEHSYVVNLNKLLIEAKTLNPVDFKKKSQVTVGDENSKYNVTLSPMKLKHMIHMMQSIDSGTTIEERKQKLYSALVMLIDNIDGITDSQHIFEFLSHIPTTWTEKIAIQAEELSKWGPTFSAKAVCKDCGQEVDLHININPLSFFTSSSNMNLLTE